MNCKFIDPFTPKVLFSDCKFSPSVEVYEPRIKPNDGNWNLSLDKKLLTDFYIAIKEAYKAGGVHDKEWNYFYKSRKAYTRYNSRNHYEKLYRLMFQEFLIGYGEKPIRSLVVSIIIIFLFTIFFMYSGLRIIDFDNNILNINYDLNLEYFINNIFNIKYHLSWINDFGSAFYYSLLNFVSNSPNNFVPINSAGKVITVIEIVLGVTLIGAWIATFFRKLIR